MKNILRILCVALALMCVLACAGETDPATVEQNSPEITDVTVDSVVINATDAPDAPETPVPAETSVPTDAPEPTEAPDPTRAPMAGDVATVNFPNYDTGVDADYSYQSDELRIAIKVQVDKESKQTCYIADIWMRNLNSFGTAFARGGFNKGSEDAEKLAVRENAILAVNGSYNQGLTIHAGKQYKGTRKNKGWNSCAVGAIYTDGSLKTFRLGKETFDAKKELKNGLWHAWQFGPIIIRDYEPGPGSDNYALGYKARNMLGYYEPGHYVIVTCDAQRDDAKGMNQDEMVAFMKSLGVKEAFNLDGGTSAVMVFMGKTINRPTKRNDNGTIVSGRPILDMLVFAEYDANGVAPDLANVGDKVKGN